MDVSEDINEVTLYQFPDWMYETPDMRQCLYSLHLENDELKQYRLSLQQIIETSMMKFQELVPLLPNANAPSHVESVIIRANRFIVHFAYCHPALMKEYNHHEFMNNLYYAGLYNELNEPAKLYIMNNLHGNKALIHEKTLKEVFGDNEAYAVAPHLNNAARDVVHENCYAGTSFSQSLVNFCLAEWKRDFYHWSINRFCYAYLIIIIKLKF